ncbi:hypothetical protein [Microbacterium sp. W4I20]|uniref:hypothetical protein n=1 Tax=Microbacterium sp. W4I20 TaxID=3042262 RepID=UPI002789E6B5|nr:hypothetical protein [Microbacterium sp. W4I20]MDQ0726825.1 hypothetical protein [Microbacterium sp. W4I20]
MPKETFWNSATAVENDGVSEPVLTVTWGADSPAVYLNGVEFDASGIERLMNVLRRAIGKERVVTVTLATDKTDFEKAIEESRARVRALHQELQDVDDLARRLGV